MNPDAAHKHRGTRPTEMKKEVGWGGLMVGRETCRERGGSSLFFLPQLRRLSVRFLRFLITADHRGRHASSIVGDDQVGVFVFEGETRAAANL